MEKDSEKEELQRNINLAFTYIDISALELNCEFKDEEKEKIQKLFQKIKSVHESHEQKEILDEIIQTIRDQLTSLATVGQILDFLSLSIKILFIENASTNSVKLLTDIFAMLPVNWETDPVKVHLITKNIYETLEGDFNNLHHVISSLICINNKLAFYVSMTLFWALFNKYFKKDNIHYFKMYSVDKFLKLLLSNESLNETQDSNTMFKLLMLISIYQNHVLLNKETPETHKVFQEFFKSSRHDREKLKNWLINVKTRIEFYHPLGKSNQSADVLMLLEFLELDLIRGISRDGLGENQTDLEDLQGIPQTDNQEKNDE